ncbi:MAG: hypothetical protein WCK58_04100 [Chloroflexota bacterium]
MQPSLAPASRGGGGARPAPRHPERQRVRRPTVVTILAGLELFNAAGYLVALLALVGITVVDIQTELGGVLAGLEGDIASGTVLMGLLAALFVTALAAGILLLRMQRTGWTITMLLTGLGLFTQIYLFWSGREVLAGWLLVNVVTVFYLNQRQVREAFGIGPALADTDGEETHR